MTAALLVDIKSVIRNTFLKLLLPFLLVTCYLLLVTSPTFAQSSATNLAASPSTLNAAPYGAAASSAYISPQSPNYATLAIYNFSHAMSCILIGQSPIAPCLEYKMYKDAKGMVRTVPYLSSVNTSNGVLGTTLSMIGAVVSTPPIRSSEFIADFGEQIGIKSAHAQVGGSGNGVLSPIFQLWEVSRNIAYLIMILVFVLVGLMVMFRQRLNPQTVVSIQMALPGLVIGLVMITFSYFLASLISDIAFIGTNLIGYYFSAAQSNFPAETPSLLARITNLNILQIFGQFVGIITDGFFTRGNAAAALNDVYTALAPKAQGDVAFFGAFIAFQFTAPIGNAIPIVGQYIAPIVGALGSGKAYYDPVGTWGWIVSWLALFVLLYSMFRLLLRLINNLLSIIFLTISAPFQFLIASLPGRQGLITDWIRNMLCNVLAFPSVIAVFYFVSFILGKTYGPFVISSGFKITAEGGAFPLLGGMRIDFVNLLIAFGALVATPAIPDIICRVIGKPGQVGQIANQTIMGNINAGRNYSNQQFSRVGAVAGTTRQAFTGDRSLVWTGSGYTTQIARPGLIDIATKQTTYPRLNPKNWLPKRSPASPPPIERA